MIISASRRTDIPAFYFDWFLNRIGEGFVMAKNPINRKQISRINLSPERIDCIVFWTKNPVPMYRSLDKISAYDYYIQYTLNLYDGDIEPAILAAKESRIDVFRSIADAIGADRIIWRYDPVIISGKYTAEYHLQNFGNIAESLAGYTKRCVISFLDFYDRIENNIKEAEIFPATADQKHYIAENFADIARKYKIAVAACSEDSDFSQYGILPSKCIDGDLIYHLFGKKVNCIKDKNQRPLCGCAGSFDIGAYDTCFNRCIYCYANRSAKKAVESYNIYDPDSPLLCGVIRGDEKIFERN